ncbi:MAG TPA: hypothetical protein VFV87_22995 [Pirellulaceae bacterium]|nr:hypothetical protein [Pirellulaceae bacterium]
MSTVLIDASTAAKLKQPQTTVEVRTEDGQLVGMFTPMREATPEDYEWARQQFTREEIAKARAETGGYTTAEVLEHLRKLESEA